MEPLDPGVAVEKHSQAQDMLMALSKDRTPETAAPDASTFVRASNSMAHRRSTADASPGSDNRGKHGRTRPDPFAAVLAGGCLDGWKKDLI